LVSIRSVLIYGFCGLLTLAVSAVGLVGVGGAFDNTLQLFAQDAVTLVDEAEQRLVEELAPIEIQARFIASEFENGNLQFNDADRIKAVLEASSAPIPDIGGMLLIRPDGFGHRLTGDRWIDGMPDFSSGNFLDAYGGATFQKVILEAAETGGPVWREPYWIPELQQTVINLHTPIWHDGEFLGVFIQGKFVADLSIRLSNLQRNEFAVPFMLYNGTRVLAHPFMAQGEVNSMQQAPLVSVGEFPDPIIRAIVRLEPLRDTELADANNVDVGQAEVNEIWHLFASRTLTDLGADRPISIGYYFNEQYYAESWNRLMHMIGAASLVLILSVAAAIYVSRATMRPIQALADASHIVAEGDLNNVPVFPKTRMRELADAAEAFKEMVAGLKERERIMDLFGRVVPQKVAERMLQSPDDLAPQTVTATVLFCDLAGFTRMTEELGPEKVVSVLNAYFTDMVDIVHEQDGIVTQFQGDAVLAVFNLPIADPEHAQKAAQAALDMRAHLQTREYSGQTLRNRIGIATGPMIAANVGAETRMNYTVHGDTVNLASRLEQMNKEYSTDIMIADTTAQLLADIPLRKLGSVPVRGRDAPVEVFTPEEI